MNKKLIITALFALVAMAGQSQEIKMNEPSFKDYLPVLNAQGYISYGFDVSMFEGKQARPVVKEYVNGQEVEDRMSRIPFPVLLPLHDELVVGFLPAKNDSTAECVIYTHGGASINPTLDRKPIQWNSKPYYCYGTRPFELVPPFKVGDFIPLVLYGSYWYDADFNVTRFCGENFVKSDLTSEHLLKDSPHYYVIGIKVEE